MSNKNYWIWLQLCFGEGAHFLPVLEEFSTVENLYNSNILERRMSPNLTAYQVDCLSKYSLADADKIINSCNNSGYKVICFDDDNYPSKLKEISNPPAVLYVDGELGDFDSNAVIGIVGTRKASTYALNAAQVMAKGMALCGAIIISGGALGVDSASHLGAIDAKSKTYAVLGSGFGSGYLKSNSELREKIKSTGGALITEYPPYKKATKFTFPMRNRIISGLSDGILVVEAGVKSGSLITAGHALEQGRDVFAIPASIFDKNFQGTNRLIDDGAYVAVSPYSVLSHYSERYRSLDLSKAKTPTELTDNDYKSANAPEKEQVTFDRIEQDRKERVEIQKLSVELDGDEKIIFDTLSENFTGIEDIIRESALPAQKVLVALTMLEMKGLIITASGKRYRKK